MLADQKRVILAALQVPKDGDPNMPGGPIGKNGAIWPWVRDGDFGAPALTMTADEAGKAITALVREGRIEIMVNRDDLEIRLTTD